MTCGLEKIRDPMLYHDRWLELEIAVLYLLYNV